MNDSQKQPFEQARQDTINNSLISTKELSELQKQIDQVSNKSNNFCDSCGFCCVDGIEMIELEVQKIKENTIKQPDLHQFQGYLCPFLNIDSEDLDHNISGYGHGLQSMRASKCRIYHDRPIICRLFPAPDEEQCRQYQISKAPNMVGELLQQNTLQGYPSTLLEKYYLTLRWEWFNLPKETKWDLKYMLIPGWQLSNSDSLFKQEGPHWLNKFDILPEFFDRPSFYQLSKWEFKVVKELKRPHTFRQLGEIFIPKMKAHKLGAFLAQLEISGLIVPTDVGLRKNKGVTHRYL